MVEAADLEPPNDEHDPEGTTAYERAQVTSEARARLTQLDRALPEIDDEGYGACQRCGQPIGWPRLQARARDHTLRALRRVALTARHDGRPGANVRKPPTNPGDSLAQAGRPPLSSCPASC
jgi:DnaK suppressor protein